MKSHAKVVVIGGGAIGVSTAYHLAKNGCPDVVLVEKHELTSGSTWMAAGNCSYYHPNFYCTQINKKSIEIYKKLEEVTGQNPGWHTTGSIRTADNDLRMQELGYYYSMNRALGIEVHWITPEEMAQKHPLMNVEGLIGGLYWPDDGDVDPSGITQAMSIGGKKLGVEINTHTLVTGITQKPGGEWVVSTDKGDITCEIVVNAGGLWAPEVGRMVGLEIPSIGIQHTHILFESIDAVVNADGYLPLVRDPDKSVYVRQEMDSLILGLYEKNGQQWHQYGVPWDYAQTELTPDIDNISECIEEGIYRFPIMGETGFKHVTAGPITYTPNADPLVGPAYPLKNFWLACGYSFGITQAGGIGHYLSGWILNGEPEIDLWSVDSRRIGSYANQGYNHQKIADTYARLYTGIFVPNEWRDAARPNRTSPIYEKQKAAGAVFADYYGWECPNYFTDKAEDAREKPSWNRSNAFPYVKAECKHVAEHVGLLDLTRFAKARITGPKAEEWLNHMSCQKAPKGVGRIALSPMLDDDGMFKTDMTMTKWAENDYFCVTASVGKRHDQHHMMLNLPTDGSVKFEDLTYRMGCFVIAGPKSRDLLAAAMWGDTDQISADNFKFGTSKELYIGRVKCRVNRMNYVGELGYELFHPLEQQLSLFDHLMEVGKQFNLKMFGMHAMESMRLEKAYLAWKVDMNRHHHPLETNIAWTVKWDKDFKGKAALQKKKDEGVKKQWVCMEVQADQSDVYGYGPIWNGDKMVGLTSGGGYGHRVEKSLAFGYVDLDCAQPGTELVCEHLGQMLKAKVVEMPVYDPKMERMKA